MSVLRLLLSYDGTGFAGFQVQPGERTVQGTVEDALARLCGGPVRLRGAGRTDAGVHAFGQVVSVDGWAGPPAEDVFRAMSSLLPRDVAVLDAQGGPDGFDARRSARWRSYVYLVWNGATRLPLYDRFMLHVPDPVDRAALADALSVVRGTHDYRSFARVREGQSPVRTVLEARCDADGDLVRISVVADAFLHQMVRSIVGSALEVASGRRTRGWMREALLARDRSAAGRVAAPHGLALAEVGYDRASWPRRSAPTWPWSNEHGSDRAAIGEM